MTETQEEHYLKPQQNWEDSDIFQDTPAKAAHLPTAERSTTRGLAAPTVLKLARGIFLTTLKMISSYICKNIFKRIETFFLKVSTSQNLEEIPQLVITRLLYMHPIQLTPCCKQNQGRLSLDSLSSSLREKLSFAGSNKGVQPFQEHAASAAFPARDSKTHNTALVQAHFHLHEKLMRRDAPCHYSIIKELASSRGAEQVARS